MTTLIALWRAIRWILKIRKKMEKGGDEVFSNENAAYCRLILERVAYALRTGKTERLPKVVQWIFRRTRLDNKFGEFCCRVLKSNKLAVCDDELDQPLYPCH